jgi:hypothetical protein
MPSITPPIFIPGSGNVDRLLWIHESEAAAADKTKISGDGSASSPPRTARARTRVSMFELSSPLPKRLRVRLEQSAARHSGYSTPRKSTSVQQAFRDPDTRVRQGCPLTSRGAGGGGHAVGNSRPGSGVDWCASTAPCESVAGGGDAAFVAWKLFSCFFRQHVSLS